MKSSRAIGILLIIAIMMWLPVAFEMNDWGDDMWHLSFLLAGVPRRTILVYHQFPFWNPYMQGGEPLLAYPMASFLSPGYLPSLLAGPVAGPKLRILISLFIGLCGGYFLGRRLAPGRFAPFLCSFLYMFSSWFALYMSHWHDEFIPFAYVPWLFLFYLKGLENVRWCALGGLTLALMIFEGGIYPVPYALLFLSIYALIEAMLKKSLTPLLSLFLIVLLGAAASGVRLLPVYDFLSRYPRPTAWREPVLPWRALPRIFFGRDQVSETDFRGAWLGWWEYGAYVGVLPMLLAAAAPFVARRKAIAVTVLALVFFCLMFGDYGSLSPWRWVHTIPLFSSLHDPVRFRVILIFCLAVMAAMTLSRLEELARSLDARRRAALEVALAALTVAVAADLMLVTSPIYSHVSTRPPHAARREGPFRQTRLPIKEQQGPLSFLCFLENEGLVNNYDPMFLRPSGVVACNEPGYRGEAWLAGDGGTVETVRWSPNRLRYKLECDSPCMLVVNQRYDPGWKADDGRPVVSRGGVMTVPVNPGDTGLTLSYRPPLFFPGLGLTAAGLFSCILLWRRQSRSA